MVIWTRIFEHPNDKMYNLFPHPVKDERAYDVDPEVESVVSFRVHVFTEDTKEVPKKFVKDILK